MIKWLKFLHICFRGELRPCFVKWCECSDPTPWTVYKGSQIFPCTSSEFVYTTYDSVEPSYRTLQLECDLSISVKKDLFQL